MLEPLQLIQKSHPRKTLKTVIDGVKRATRLGNYWYWLEPPELMDGVDIASLICPLRYDVIIRKDFYTFYAAHRHLYYSDFNAFLELVRQGPYYTWYVRSESVRTRPYLASDEERLIARFTKQVHEAVALYESMYDSGFDNRFPIILRTAEQLLPPTGARQAPPTGKFLSDRYFLADGCHRLAFLMTMGCTVLPASYFRVQCFKEFSPFDSTSLLAKSLPITPANYFAFLSNRYCRPLVLEDKESLLVCIRERKPELVEEVLSIIRVDGFDSTTS